MRRLDLDAVRKYVNENIGAFHQGRIGSLQNLDLNLLIEMNPYPLRAKQGDATARYGAGVSNEPLPAQGKGYSQQVQAWLNPTQLQPYQRKRQGQQAALD